MKTFVDAAEKSPAVPMPLTALICTLFGAVIGFGGLYLLGWLYRWVGSWFGGQASNVEVRAALAWSGIPLFWLYGLLTLGRLLSFAAGLLLGSSQAGKAIVEPVVGTLAIAVGITAIVGSIWALVIFSRMMGEVHRFSGWKGFWTLVISHVSLFISIVAFGVLCFSRGRDAAHRQAGQQAGSVEQQRSGAGVR